MLLRPTSAILKLHLPVMLLLSELFEQLSERSPADVRLA